VLLVLAHPVQVAGGQTDLVRREEGFRTLTGSWMNWSEKTRPGRLVSKIACPVVFRRIWREKTGCSVISTV
jgi:hypothetical protein